MESDSSGLIPYLILLIASIAAFVVLRLSAIALTRSQSAKFEKVSENKFPLCKLAKTLLENTDRYLFTTQLAMLIFGLISGAACLKILTLRPISNLVVTLTGDSFFVWLIVCLVAIVLVASIAILLVQLGKALIYRQTEKFLCIISPLLLLISFTLRPFQIVLDDFARNLFNKFGIEIPIERELAVSAEEISRIVALSTEAGEIEEDEQEMLQGVFEFSETLAQEVMTPRTDIVSVKTDSSLEEVVETFVASGHSRLIVIGEDLDDVKGILLAKDLTPLVGKANGDFKISNLMRPAYFVAGAKQIDDVLNELRSEAIHLAVVLDEHGGVDGVVTLEDLIEEIVGEIFDEFDRPADETEVKAMKSGDLLVDGSMSLHDLNQLHGYKFEEGEYDTIAGYVIHKLGRIPDEGEAEDFNGVKIKIEQLVQNRIVLLRVSPPSNSSELAG